MKQAPATPFDPAEAPDLWSLMDALDLAPASEAGDRAEAVAEFMLGWLPGCLEYARPPRRLQSGRSQTRRGRRRG
jgi:hypothetical protein